MSAKDKQVGGEHYRDMPVQLAEFVIPNKIGYYPSSVIKRMCRYNKPTGKGLQDLEKAKHEIDLIIEIEGWGRPKSVSSTSTEVQYMVKNRIIGDMSED